MSHPDGRAVQGIGAFRSPPERESPGQMGDTRLVAGKRRGRDSPTRVLDDRYEIEDQIGSGGMGRVFRATDRTLKRRVAVKVLSPSLAKDRGAVERFRREAQAAAALSHPNVVSVFDSGSVKDVHYIVMEYVEGKTLKDEIADEGALAPDRAVAIAESIARGLAAAHEAGVAHRDIKPGNVLLTSEGQVKVMDFGIARAVNDESSGKIFGTAAYVSPEQARGKRGDARSDVYALGCVLHEMLTGHQPFTADSPVAVAYKHVSEDAPPPSSVNPAVPERLDAVVARAMAKDPEARYRSAGKMQDELEAIAGDDATAPIAPVSDTGPVPDEDQEPSPRRRLSLVWLLILLGGLSAVALVPMILLGSPVAPETPGRGDRVEVPNVEGKTLEEARRILLRADLRPKVIGETPSGAELVVADQRPEAGARLQKGDRVELVVEVRAQETTTPSPSPTPSPTPDESPEPRESPSASPSPSPSASPSPSPSASPSPSPVESASPPPP